MRTTSARLSTSAAARTRDLAATTRAAQQGVALQTALLPDVPTSPSSPATWLAFQGRWGQKEPGPNNGAHWRGVQRAAIGANHVCRRAAGQQRHRARNQDARADLDELLLRCRQAGFDRRRLGAFTSAAVPDAVRDRPLAVFTVLIGDIAAAFGSVLTTAAVAVALREMASRRSVTARQAFRTALDRLRPLAAAALVQYVVVLLLTLTVVGIPVALHRFVRWSLFAQACMLEDRTGLDALARSSKPASRSAASIAGSAPGAATALHGRPGCSFRGVGLVRRRAGGRLLSRHSSRAVRARRSSNAIARSTTGARSELGGCVRATIPNETRAPAHRRAAITRAGPVRPLNASAARRPAVRAAMRAWHLHVLT